MSDGRKLGQNLTRMFERSVERHGTKPFLFEKREGVYAPMSWSEVAADVDRLAAFLIETGIRPGDRVALVQENGPRWCIADLAIMAAGAISVPSYITYTAKDYAYLLGHSEARMVITGGASLARRLAPAVAEAGAIEHVVYAGAADDAAAFGKPVTFWDDALEAGAGGSPDRPGRDHARDETACFIYTSGTGGHPKGVMLSHANIMANIEGASDVLDKLELKEDERFLSFLPLSHSYEHTAGQFLPIAIGAQIYYAESVEALQRNLVEARPTILPCVPRLFEVLRLRILHGIEKQPPMKKRLFEKALEVGTRRYLNGGRLGLLDRAADVVLDRLVRDKVRERFGGRLKAFVSGGAPLGQDVGLFFTALGLPVLQGYGQTEAGPVISVNPPGRSKLDTVGPPLNGVEVRIAEDGEILVRGQLVMKGYWKDAEATEATIRDGWLHTGDVGVFDEDGYLKITDRKKDLIVNSGGDNVAPQRVEGILALEADIGQIVVFGDRRPHLVAVVVPSDTLLAEIAAREGRAKGDPELAISRAVHERIDDAIKRSNERLSVIEKVRRFAIIAEPFSVTNGMMTPTMKLRRAAIYKNYGEIIEGLYAKNK